MLRVWMIHVCEVLQYHGHNLFIKFIWPPVCKYVHDWYNCKQLAGLL